MSEQASFSAGLDVAQLTATERYYLRRIGQYRHYRSTHGFCMHGDARAINSKMVGRLQQKQLVKIQADKRPYLKLTGKGSMLAVVLDQRARVRTK